MANNRKIMEQLIKKSNKFLPLSAFSLLRRSHLFFFCTFLLSWFPNVFILCASAPPLTWWAFRAFSWCLVTAEHPHHLPPCSWFTLWGPLPAASAASSTPVQCLRHHLSATPLLPASPSCKFNFIMLRVVDAYSLWFNLSKRSTFYL